MANSMAVGPSNLLASRPAKPAGARRGWNDQAVAVGCQAGGGGPARATGTENNLLRQTLPMLASSYYNTGAKTGAGSTWSPRNNRSRHRSGELDSEEES